MAGRNGTDDPLVTDLLEAAPWVGKILGTLARRALKANEWKATEKCLRDAVAIDTRASRPGWIHPAQRFRFGRAWTAAKQRAANDIFATGFTFGEGGSRKEKPLDKEGRASTGSGVQRDVPEDLPKSLVPVWELGRGELDKALYAEPFVPWTLEMSAVITHAATSKWDQLEDELKKNPDVDPTELRSMACLILGRDDARNDQVSRLIDEEALNAFGVRVGQRFEANLCANNNLTDLVERLDKHDELKAQVAMITAVQGIRIALVALLITIVLVAGMALMVTDGPL